MNHRFVASCLGAFSLAFGSAAFADPQAQHCLPHGVQRGTEAKFVIKGQQLDDALELMLYDKGMEVVSLTVPTDDKRKGKELDVVVKIAADCPLGSQRMRVRTATGQSDIVNLSVGALPIVEENEPNTEFTKSQQIELDRTIHGQIANEDVDYFSFDAKQGDRVNIEVVGLRLGVSSSGNFFDPYLAILDEKKFEIATSDDTPLGWNDPSISFVAPADGRFTIELRDVSYNGDGNAYYLMHVGKFPLPAAISPLGGKPGETVNVQFLGDPLGEFTKPFVVPQPGDEGLVYVEAAGDTGVAPSSFPFRSSPLENVLEQEPNETVKEAIAAPAPGAWNGKLDKPGDIDCYKFTAKKGQVFDINVYGRRLRTAIDAVLTIRKADGGGLASNDDNRNPDSYVRFTAPADGEYIAEIRDQLRNGGPGYTYRIEATAVTPRVSATTAEIRRYVLPNFAIPQGGAHGYQMTVARQDVGGAVRMIAENLPKGVTLDHPAEWASDGTMPFVLRAAADAPLSGAWSTLNVECGDPAKPETLARAALSQEPMLVRGRNAERMWTERQERMPVVVTNAAPFKVRLEGPKGPIVQGGGCSLKVVVERAPEYKEAINVLLLQNPPGCSSNTAAQIPKDQNETTITLNAATNAAVRMSPIAVRAFADINGRTIETCSEFIPLTVEAPFIKFEFEQAAVVQGKETPLLVKVEKRRDWDGEAEVKLVGLPAKAEAAPLKLTKDQAELVFTVKTAADTPAGTTKGVLCQVQVPLNGEQIAHSLGSGRLRVDTPPKEAPAVAAQPAAPAAAPPKPISRLEQLRLEQKARDEAAKSGGATKE
ncbi:putative subtilase-type serine protease precursor [Caulifigura coniformis]|uniref:Putative subtilase-type serine protease n=1 Tax=Caulifigura coniformis TaxID=2527983 RepID=A0A517SM24_9PLAN|nr:PPC domain-containing protein [Caulifigura coniformis]QDT57174.1 putative subtilase-type serine protease precursor [Caulifigura coniformis]